MYISTPYTIKDALSPAIVERLCYEYWDIGTYRSETMNKADPDRAMHIIEPIIRANIPDLGEFLGGNFYRHTVPYFPHTDHQMAWNDSVNIVIPISVKEGADPFPHLVVFDQWWEGDPKTWTLDYPIMEGKISSSTNQQIQGRICDTQGVHGLTNVDIDESFADTYLYRSREQYFGMSGKALRFTPGDMIVFSNKHIHCTSKFGGEKIGISLRYRTNK